MVDVPTRSLTPTAEASFLAYLHYLEDLAGVIAGGYGRGIEGVQQTMALHPPVRALTPRTTSPVELAELNAHSVAAWQRLAAVDNAVEAGDRQANAVIPLLADEAVVAAGRALSVALQATDVESRDDVLALLGDAAADELFPYPWSALCHGCPQLGATVYGGGLLPGDAVSVFHAPRADTSDARVAMLLRTTRQRIIEREFARARRTDIRPGRTRRNLTAEHKERIAEQVPPTTVFDVFERVRRRVEEDDGVAFVEAPFDDVEALRLGEALAFVTDTTVAVVEAVTARIVGEDVYRDLLGSHVRRTPGSTAAQRRLSATKRP